MTSWLKETKLVNDIANNMLAPKKVHYQEDFIRNYQIIQDIKCQNSKIWLFKILMSEMVTGKRLKRVFFIILKLSLIAVSFTFMVTGHIGLKGSLFFRLSPDNLLFVALILLGVERVKAISQLMVLRNVKIYVNSLSIQRLL